MTLYESARLVFPRHIIQKSLNVFPLIPVTVVSEYGGGGVGMGDMLWGWGCVVGVGDVL